MGGERIGPGKERAATVRQEIAAVAAFLTLRDSVGICEGQQQTYGVEVRRASRRSYAREPLELALHLAGGACDAVENAAVDGSAVDLRTRPVQKIETKRPFLQSFDVSFYGADPEQHDTLDQRPGSYNNTLSAIRLLSV